LSTIGGLAYDGQSIAILLNRDYTSSAQGTARENGKVTESLI